MDIRSDRGISLAELLVTVSLLFVVLTLVYFSVDTLTRANDVTDRQAQFARDIATPLHAMDKVLCQNKALLNSGTNVSNEYQITARGPVTPGTNKFRRYIYAAGTDGRLTEQIYDEQLGSSTSTLVKTNVWSTANANRVKGPMFTYLGPSGETTIPAGARSVLIKVWTLHEGQYYSGERQVFFRNR